MMNPSPYLGRGAMEEDSIAYVHVTLLFKDQFELVCTLVLDSVTTAINDLAVNVKSYLYMCTTAAYPCAVVFCAQPIVVRL